ncbi:adenosine deaminase [Paraglaciecola psychrophila 170]|uniref:adenosine deaminase n=1 Tax=Paraglaciecola psychrophila 170 TaxID=1129794 RepID=K7AMY8_9ALTE|nr:adenosine deaminase [Paraglaciecola psychrophila 170]GAC36750.1 adenosine deaminase [Paraglaciecola psychrophila 170]
MPLTDLHRHLDGNIRPSTIWQLAQEFSIPLQQQNLEELIQATQVQFKTTDLLAFLQQMELGVSVLASEQACYRVAYENVEDAKRAGLTYVELRFSPVFMAQAHNLPIEQVVDAVVAGCKAGSKKFGVPVNLIGILSRSYGEATCYQELWALLRAKDDIVALDLAGDEKGFPAIRFKQHFKLARDAGWNITVHAGEADGPHSIWQAIDELGATRIGHSVAARKDPHLMDFMAKNDISIECCLTSNFQTGAFTDIAHHPIKTFIERGIVVTLNTDDPGVSGIEIADEYRLAREVVGLSAKQLAQIQLNGVEVAFAGDSVKWELLSQSR